MCAYKHTHTEEIMMGKQKKRVKGNGRLRVAMTQLSIISDLVTENLYILDYGLKLNFFFYCCTHHPTCRNTGLYSGSACLSILCKLVPSDKVNWEMQLDIQLLGVCQQLIYNTCSCLIKQWVANLKMKVISRSSLEALSSSSMLGDD